MLLCAPKKCFEEAGTCGREPKIMCLVRGKSAQIRLNRANRAEIKFPFNKVGLVVEGD